MTLLFNITQKHFMLLRGSRLRGFEIPSSLSTIEWCRMFRFFAHYDKMALFVY